MYTYVSSVVKNKGSAGRWIEVDLSNEKILSLFQTYQTVYLILSNPSLSHDVSLNIADASPLINLYPTDITVKDWLVAIGNLTLPTTDYIPRTNTKKVLYNDLYNAGYKVQLVHRQAAVDSQLPDSEKQDALVTRPLTDYQKFYESCLVTVNGFVHMTDYGTDGVRILDAGRTNWISNEHHIGVMSFREIGKLTHIPITEDMVHCQPESKLYDGAFIQLPEDIGDRVPLLVVGGYLQILDDSYFVAGERSICVKMKKLAYIDRFFSSRKYIDMSSVEALCTRDTRNPDHFAYKELVSDPVLKKYLTLSQSFVVLVDTDNLFVELHKLEYTRLPGRYYAYQQPRWPLMTELGRLPAYVADREEDTWVVSLFDNLTEQRRYHSYEYQSELSLDGARITSMPYIYSPGYLLEIGSDVKV